MKKTYRYSPNVMRALFVVVLALTACDVERGRELPPNAVEIEQVRDGYRAYCTYSVVVVCCPKTVSGLDKECVHVDDVVGICGEYVRRDTEELPDTCYVDKCRKFCFERPEEG